jgi:hypothetical protein
MLAGAFFAPICLHYFKVKTTWTAAWHRFRFLLLQQILKYHISIWKTFCLTFSNNCCFSSLNICKIGSFKVYAPLKTAHFTVFLNVIFLTNNCWDVSKSVT